MYSYGDDDLNRTEGPDEKDSGDEDSRESNSVSIPHQESLQELRFLLCLTDAASSVKVCFLRKLQPGYEFTDAVSIVISGNFVVLCLLLFYCTSRVKVCL